MTERGSTYRLPEQSACQAWHTRSGNPPHVPPQKLHDQRMGAQRVRDAAALIACDGRWYLAWLGCRNASARPQALRVLDPATQRMRRTLRRRARVP
jgi:hypothetical protein